ncbi:serine hydrolase [Geodermatophilus sp. URMC 63]
MAASEVPGPTGRDGDRWAWRPVVLFCAVALPAAGALQLVADATGSSPQAWSLVQFAPSIAVAAVLAVSPPLRSLVAATVRGSSAATVRRLGPVAGTVALVLLAYVGVRAVLGEPVEVLPLRDLTAPLAVVASLALLGACGEELGWRCLLQPLLRRRFPVLGASTVVGLLWTAWHVQVLARGVVVAGAFVLAGVAMSVVLGVAVERGRGSSLLIAGVFHALVNLGGLLLRDDGVGDGADGWVFALVWVLAAAVWVLADRRSPRRPAAGTAPRRRAPRAGTLPGLARATAAGVVAGVAGALVLLPGAAASAAPAGGVAPTGVEQRVRAQLAASSVPVASYAVVDGGRVRTGGWGPGIDGDTPFVIGSVTKTVTALAVVQLADRGLVDLDAPAARYLPGFRTADPAAVVTVRHLLEQTSGLPTEAGLDVYADPRLSLRARVAGAADVEPVSRPGDAFHYCNLNYAVLGLLVERVSGRSFGDYVEDEVFAPLGMAHSSVRLADAAADGLPEGSTVWFGLSVGQDARWYDGALADGQLVSTAHDLATYLRFQLGDGTWQGRRVVSAAGLRAMHTAAVPTPPGAAAEDTASYGLGWGIGSVGGHRVVAHGGDEVGFHADVGLLPDTGQALVVLTARNGFLTDPAAAYRAGLHALAGLPAADPSRAFGWTYAVVDAATVLALAAMGWSLWRRRRWAASLPGRAARRGRWGALAPTVVLDVLLAGALYLGVFVGLGTLLLGSPFTVPLLLGSTPDLLCLVLAGIAFSLVKAVLDLLLGLRALGRPAGRRARPVPTAAAARRSGS